VTLVVVAVLGADSLTDLMVSAAVVLLLVAARVIAGAIRRRMAGTSVEISAEGWLRFVALLGTLTVLLANIDAYPSLLARSVVDLAANPDRDPFFESAALPVEPAAVLGVVVVALAYVTAVLYVGLELLRTLPKILDDLRQVILFARAHLHRLRWAAALARLGAAWARPFGRRDAQADGPVALGVLPMLWLLYATLAAMVAAVLAVLLSSVLPRLL
jgi:hypothetical protein